MIEVHIKNVKGKKIQNDTLRKKKYITPRFSVSKAKIVFLLEQEMILKKNQREYINKTLDSI